MAEKVEVIVGSIRSRIPDLSPELKSMLYDAMAIPIKGARFSPQVRQGLWDGKIRFFGINGGFATGLLDHVQALLNDSGIELDPVDDRRVIIPTPRIPELPPLIGITEDANRDYQGHIVDESLFKRRGIILAAVNAGKSIIAMEIIRRLRVNTLYIVPTKELFRQFTADVKQMLPGMSVGEIRDEGTFKPALLTIGMVQSIVKRIDAAHDGPDPRHDPFLRWLRDDVEMVMVDEGHHFKGKKWGQVFTEAKRALYKYALSATPLGGDKVKDMTLIGFTGSVLKSSVTTQELVKRGLSVPTTVRMISYEKTPDALEHISTSGFFTPGGLYERGICDYPPRATAMYQTIKAHCEAGERVLIFVDRVDHGDFLEYLGKSMAGTAVWSPQFLHGEQPMFKRLAILHRFVKAERPLLITTVLKEGVNIPEIDVIVNACGMESPTKAKQQAGRNARTREGKVQSIIYDFLDATHERLLDHSAGRLKAYRSEGYKIELIKCYQG